jgi:hypothetical protein
MGIDDGTFEVHLFSLRNTEGIIARNRSIAVAALIQF